MKSKKIIDLFCGAGGLSLGFEKAGFEIEFAIDMWEDAINTYNHNHANKVAKCQDIHELTDEFLKSLKGKIVGVIGGPPCQGYSTVGTRDVNDPRNHLYLEYCRVVENVDPDFFVIENVRGLLTLGKGAFKDDIINRFSKLGYNVNYKLVNAFDYKVSSSDALSDLPSLESLDLFSGYYLTEPQNTYQKMMRQSSDEILNHEPTKHTDQTKKIISMIPDGGKISDLPEEYWNVRKYNKAFQRMNSKLPSNTIDTGHRNYFHYSENRVPSVRESARIQSFPDDFEFIGSKTSQYKQVGNAVPPLLARVIAEEIMKVI